MDTQRFINSLHECDLCRLRSDKGTLWAEINLYDFAGLKAFEIPSSYIRIILVFHQVHSLVKTGFRNPKPNQPYEINMTSTDGERLSWGLVKEKAGKESFASVSFQYSSVEILPNNEPAYIDYDFGLFAFEPENAFADYEYSDGCLTINAKFLEEKKVDEKHQNPGIIYRFQNILPQTGVDAKRFSSLTEHRVIFSAIVFGKNNNLLFYGNKNQYVIGLLYGKAEFQIPKSPKVKKHRQ